MLTIHTNLSSTCFLQEPEKNPPSENEKKEIQAIHKDFRTKYN